MGNKLSLRGFLLVFSWLLMSSQVQANNSVVNVAFLTEKVAVPAALSNLDPILADEGIQGALLGVQDNNTTGQFSGHQYGLKSVVVPLGADVVAAFESLVEAGYEYLVVNVQKAALKQLTVIAREKNVLLFNVSVADGEFRNAACGTNLFNVIPSYEMRADALAQFMLKKRWNKWFLVKGLSDDDLSFAKAIKRSAKRFGMKIVEEKSWSFQHDTRRTAQSEIPVFTQGAEYDVLVVADVKGLFGDYLSMNTWLPRPIVGTQGLVPRAWHRTHERWGAVQMQNRFYKQADRWMSDVDYASWLAVRTVGEAVTRTNSIDSMSVKQFILSDKFSLAGFKGTKLTFRPWNQQLRQPVLLATPRSIVSVLPHKEFLHPLTYLDTLGYDKPESSCSFNP